MGKSNYELYAEKKQSELLDKTASLRLAISMLKDYKGTFSEEYIEAWTECIATLYGLQSVEIKRAVNGEEYWCV